jgi:hypothetical protein
MLLLLDMAYQVVVKMAVLMVGLRQHCVLDLVQIDHTLLEAMNSDSFCGTSDWEMTSGDNLLSVMY